ncbi:peptidoglycan D,D-transpeptidase FtsI family protein [Oceanicella actignis]|uniref:peptidoglycan D,D-transpeptidase FtsI family protein n=1 Tax=Oceanicella actignis TaxID=1189325 RepID=UPI001258E4C9|nr:penicillin-binding protein 2 [Oceanicella actignis]TYO91526.1 cell division protein FtsI (penicillin-binding protein 3) [Oceanicella actignis]
MMRRAAPEPAAPGAAAGAGGELALFERPAPPDARAGGGHGAGNGTGHGAGQGAGQGGEHGAGWAPDPDLDDAAALGGARLADVIAARSQGRDPNAEAARRRRERERRRQAELRRRAQWRVFMLCGVFLLAYAALAGRMAHLAGSDPAEPGVMAAGPGFSAVRAEIRDRNGAVLAANVPVWSLYARPDEMVDPAAAARGLARIFPDLDEKALLRRFTDGRRFLWIRRAITPAERLAVHDLGEPGLKFGPREARVYPAGRAAAHVLGGASYGKEGVAAAEIVGVAGVERHFDARLRDPARAAEPLRLSIDLRVQAAFAEVLDEAMKRLHARGAAGVLMDARNGEVLALVSLPDFDPNRRPPPPVRGRPDDHPTFNRAAQGVYELGSTFKPFTAAMVMEAGLAGPDTLVDTRGPLYWGRFRISDFHRMPDQMTLREVLVESSNVGTARLAILAGARRLQDFLARLGLFEPLPVELPEARSARPLTPPNWSEISTMTVSYGHGISVTPLHLAAAYATLANGGLRVRPTLVAGARPPGEEARVISAETSRRLREMLRAVVTEGTGRNADVPGYEIAGKTGTAEKPRTDGRGYDHDKVIATFAGFFPAHDPRYVIVATTDEAVESSGRRPRRTAGWTAAPIVAEAVRRIAPILGMRPLPAPRATADAGGAPARAALR